QLVRRNNNNQLATRNFPEYGNAMPNQHGWENAEDEEDLEAQALKAKRDAQAKRKQIPPFVQKLSSFLDNSNHTDLIRWSDDGTSFVVIDEDEFAKTLIPELFKHNNYASFVRQLNMYGFHKKVGLSDNSMRQAERREKKTPSEYWNKYFRRGRPELLWLIQKPKATPLKRKREDEPKKSVDSEDEGRKFTPETVEGQTGAHTGGADDREMQLIPKADYTSMRNEIRQLQHQQKLISGIIQQMRRQNDQWYQQASQFQKMHERHESSINAILTFLATFYNRSLEGQNGVNIADMFPSAIPSNAGNHGTVVDVGDFNEMEMPKKNIPQRQNRKPLALLPAPLAREKEKGSVSAASSCPSPSPRRSSSIFRSQQPQPQPQPHSSVRNLSTSPQTAAEHDFSATSKSPQIKSDAGSPNVMQVPENSDDMMSVINSVNANAHANTRTGPQMDFPAALSHYQTADGNTPLTSQQREQMLSLMHNAASPNMGASGGDTPNNGINSRNNSTHSTINNALLNPQPPPMPSLEHFPHSQEQFDVLQKLQEEQASRVQSLSERLAPMSPNGSIPGMSGANYGTNSNGSGNAPPSDFDLDSYINTDASYFADPNTGDGAADPNFDDQGMDFDFGGLLDHNAAGFGDGQESNLFGLDGAGSGVGVGAGVGVGGAEGVGGEGGNYDGGGRIVESVSSEATSPAGTTVEDAAGVGREDG
ncbi:hypothetical protein K490DRAFT_11203, partial [Saccharata proteae CBS 121410]